ncbi:MAG TPA: outer membrane beta-barrel protein [Niabella sp.]|nr:outer membrane beta-barrel protein [Niabella sp.]
MKKILFAACALFIAGSLFAQVDTASSPALVVSEPVKKPKKKYNLSNRANDHFLLQLGYTNWLDAPDSIQTKGFSRSINAYFMFDFPFKTSQQLSAGIGAGIGSDHVFLDGHFADVKGKTATMRFNGLDTSTVGIKKTKVVTTYAEIPIELRYVANPEQSDKSFKFAVGVKVGTMLKGGTRSRITTPTSSPNYLLKESDKTYFNTTRIVGTARIGMGHFTLFGTYQFTSLLKTGAGPQLKPFTVGLSFGGL